MANLSDKIATATKWSTVSEVLAKLVTPISTMILARILTPDAYGAVAITAIVISFAELFTDSGFPKYLIQHDFQNDDEKWKSANVAFWTNLTMSLIIWAIIILFRHQIAVIVGSPELGNAIAVACVAIPITAFSSIQTALFKRDFDFKTLFYVRISGIAIPFFATIPLALWLKNYWALIAGTILYKVATAFILAINSKWQPKLYYCFDKLKEMLSFCIWIITNDVITYFTGYIDIFLISQKFDQHHLGIYRTAVSTSTHIITLISAVIVPVLLPAYSKLQNDHKMLREAMLKIQKYLGIIILPLGFGIFLYSDLVTSILLGGQWAEASPIIGIWGLLHTFSLLINRSCTNAYIAIGRPKFSVLAQTLYAFALIPAIIISSNISFEAVYYTRAFAKIWMIVINLILIYTTIKQSTLKIFSNIMKELSGCIVMSMVSFLLSTISDNIEWQIASIIICGIVYFATICIFKDDRQALSNIVNYAKKQLQFK